MGKDARFALKTVLFAGIGSTIGIWLYNVILTRLNIPGLGYGYASPDVNNLVGCLQGCISAATGQATTSDIFAAPGGRTGGQHRQPGQQRQHSGGPGQGGPGEGGPGSWGGRGGGGPGQLGPSAAMFAEEGYDDGYQMGPMGGGMPPWMMMGGGPGSMMGGGGSCPSCGGGPMSMGGPMGAGPGGSCASCGGGGGGGGPMGGPMGGGGPFSSWGGGQGGGGSPWGYDEGYDEY